jgi:putative membrane protein
MTKLKSMQLSLAAAAVIASGCSKSSSEEPAAAASQGDEASPQEQDMARGMSDGQLLQVLATVDTGEIKQAQVALSKASSPQVRNFASDMIEQHTRAKQQGAALSSQHNLALRPSPISEKLDGKATQTLEQLQSADSRSFDSAYMQAQVKQHDEVLKMLDDKLITAASSAPVKQQLTEARSMVQQHLTHAKQLAGDLGSTGIQGSTGSMEQ